MLDDGVTRGLLVIAIVLLAPLGSWIPFVRTASAGSTEHVSVDAEGQPVPGQTPSMSVDGRFVAFASGARVLVRDRLTRTTITVSDSSENGFPTVIALAMSANGRSIVFNTRRFEPGQTGVVTPGRRCPISSDPRGTAHYVVAVHDLDTGVTTALSEACIAASSGIPARPTRLSISGDGRLILTEFYAGDLRAPAVVDRQTGEALPVRLDDAISADGRFVTGRLTNGSIEHNNLRFGVLVQDPRSGAIEGISHLSARQGGAAGLNDSGRFLVFSLDLLTPSPPAPKLGVFVHDRQRADTEMVSVARDGAEPDGDSCLPSISANGQFVVFVSSATNLVAGDDNAVEDVFVHDRLTRVTQRVNIAEDGRAIGIPALNPGTTCVTSRPVISGDGRFVAFESNLTVFVRDRGPTVTSFVTDLYESVLGRTPDSGERDGWEAFLGGHCNDTGLGATVAGFIDSSEFHTRPLTLTGLVETMYRALLGRSPEPAGLAGYSAALRQQRIDLATRLLESPEFLRLLPNRQDPAAVTATVTRLYREMLGRLPDQSELAGWVGYVTATGDIEGAVRGFIISLEFENRPLTFSGYVRILYLALLGRDPDPAEARSAEGALRAHLVRVAEEFVASPEFQVRGHDICGT